LHFPHEIVHNVWAVGQNMFPFTHREPMSLLAALHVEQLLAAGQSLTAVPMDTVWSEETPL